MKEVCRSEHRYMAVQALRFYAQPLDWEDPIHLGAERLVWRLTEEDGVWVVAGFTQEELADA